MIRTPLDLLAAFACVPLLLIVGCERTATEEYQQFSEETIEVEPPTRAEIAASRSEGPPPEEPASSPDTVIAAKPVTTESALEEEPMAVAVDEPAGTSQPGEPEGSQPVAQASFSDPVVPLDQEVATEPRQIELLVPVNSFHEEGPQDAVRVSYDDLDLLKVLNMEPVPPDAVSYFPDWLQELDGRRIRLRGFMFPPFQERNIKRFILARDNQICCFGRDPKPYDVIPVKLRDGHTTDYIANRPFDVVGLFRISPVEIDGEVSRLYLIDEATVLP